jgi:hypothetical protein
MPSLVVRPVDGVTYRVTGGKAAHIVDPAAPSCDCPDFAFRGKQRPCKHLRAVAEFRAADPLGPMLDALTDRETLDLVDPSHGYTPAPVSPLTIDPEDRAVARIALARWREYRQRKQRPPFLLWLAACHAANGLEWEQTMPTAAAEAFAEAHVAVTRLAGRKGAA